MGRKQAIPTRWRMLAALVLLALAGFAYGWWQFSHWMPERSEWPAQGVLIGEDNVPAGETSANFVAFKAIGADFAYLEASSGATGRDPAFARNMAAVREAGLRFGAVHGYDPCISAEIQAANFVIVVPRDDSLLPPAIHLDATADDCEDRISDAGVESELTTFLNQLESHSGKPALLKISADFEERYGLANRIERNLWLERDWFQPDYAGRPWTLWTANSSLRTQASGIPVRWVVVRR